MGGLSVPASGGPLTPAERAIIQHSMSADVVDWLSRTSLLHLAPDDVDRIWLRDLPEEVRGLERFRHWADRWGTATETERVDILRLVVSSLATANAREGGTVLDTGKRKHAAAGWRGGACFRGRGGARGARPGEGAAAVTSVTAGRPAAKRRLRTTSPMPRGTASPGRQLVGSASEPPLPSGTPRRHGDATDALDGLHGMALPCTGEQGPAMASGDLPPTSTARGIASPVRQLASSASAPARPSIYVRGHDSGIHAPRTPRDACADGRSPMATRAVSTSPLHTAS